MIYSNHKKLIGRIRNRIFGTSRAVLASFLVIACVFLLHTVKVQGSPLSLPAATPTPPDPRFELFKGTCTTYGPAYKGSAMDAEKRKKVFGRPDDPSNLVDISFFDYAVQVHKKVAPCLTAVERDLKAQDTSYVIEEIGAYRPEREDRPYWFHQYGGAVDINPSTNPQCLETRIGVDPLSRCAEDKPYDLPKEWVETFERYGFYWGGHFSRTKDYMHFEWHGE